VGGARIGGVRREASEGGREGRPGMGDEEMEEVIGVGDGGKGG
jgi:hypothetical protein